MDETPPELAPELVAPIRIPRKPLWACWLIPTVVTLMANLLTALGPMDNYAYNYWWAPLAAGPITGLICTPWILSMLRLRYAGRSLVLLTIAYPVAQLIITPMIGFGGCFLTAEFL